MKTSAYLFITLFLFIFIQSSKAVIPVCETIDEEKIDIKNQNSFVSNVFEKFKSWVLKKVSNEINDEKLKGSAKIVLILALLALGLCGVSIFIGPAIFLLGGLIGLFSSIWAINLKQITKNEKEKYKKERSRADAAMWLGILPACLILFLLLMFFLPQS